MSVPKVKVSTLKSFSVAWLVPIVALLIAGGLYYKTKSEQGPVIRVLFRNGSGLIAGHTPLKYHGIEVGKVENLSISEDGGYAIAEVQLIKSAAQAASAGSKYWIVRSEIGLSRIKHLGALVSGPYIEVKPGNGEFQCTFLAEQEPDIVDLEAEKPGKDFVLKAKRVGSVQKGDSVYYKEMPVGYVKKIGLAKNSQSVIMQIHIESKFVPLVRTNSKFWNISGLDVGFGLTGLKIHSRPINSVLSGGIAFATPEKLGYLAKANRVFELYEKAHEDWANWSPYITLNEEITSLGEVELCEIR